MSLPLKYNFLEYKISNFCYEKEGKEYESCHFKEGNDRYIGRTAKLTPKKIGLFVTLWKRNNKGITTPYGEYDSIDFVIIFVSENKQDGFFKFPKSILLEKGILQSKTKNGKRGFRVYPPWSEPKSKQAAKTKSWQINYFSYITK